MDSSSTTNEVLEFKAPAAGASWWLLVFATASLLLLLAWAVINQRSLLAEGFINSSSEASVENVNSSQLNNQRQTNAEAVSVADDATQDTASSAAKGMALSAASTRVATQENTSELAEKADEANTDNVSDITQPANIQADANLPEAAVTQTPSAANQAVSASSDFLVETETETETASATASTDLASDANEAANNLSDAPEGILVDSALATEQRNAQTSAQSTEGAITEVTVNEVADKPLDLEPAAAVTTPQPEEDLVEKTAEAAVPPTGSADTDGRNNIDDVAGRAIAAVAGTNLALDGNSNGAGEASEPESAIVPDTANLAVATSAASTDQNTNAKAPQNADVTGEETSESATQESIVALATLPEVPSNPAPSAELLARTETPFERARREELAALATLSESIKFRDLEVEPLDSSKAPLDRIFELLFLYSESDVTVEVAGSEFDTDTDNVLISRERAQALITYLAGRGLDEDRFTIRALGKGRLPDRIHRVKVTAEVVDR